RFILSSLFDRNDIHTESGGRRRQSPEQQHCAGRRPRAVIKIEFHIKTKSDHATLVQRVQPQRSRRNAENDSDRSFPVYLCVLCGGLYQYSYLRQLIIFGSSVSSNSNDGSSSSTLQISSKARGTSVMKRDGRCNTVWRARSVSISG